MGPDRNRRFELRGKRVWIAGHTGLVGSALVRRLQQEDCRLILASHEDVDLIRQSDTEAFFERERPQVVFLAAALVGGILANARFPADFLYENLMIAANVMRAAHVSGVEKLLLLGSSCVYPRDARQPIHESALLTGPLETTNEAYAIAKIAGLKLAAAYRGQHGDRFITAMPSNLYGPNDNYDPETAHVLPALVRRIHEAHVQKAASVTIWGSGRPLREFLHVDDLADACVFLVQHYDGSEPINVGTGSEISILRLAEVIAEIVGFEGDFVFDGTKPDGTPRKLVDTSKMEALGWRAKIDLDSGIRELHRRWLASVPSGAPVAGGRMIQISSG